MIHGERNDDDPLRGGGSVGLRLCGLLLQIMLLMSCPVVRGLPGLAVLMRYLGYIKSKKYKKGC